MLRISGKIVSDYFNPWPISPSKKEQFKVYFLLFSKARKFKSCWDLNGKRCSIQYMAQIIEARDWAGKRHYVRSMARSPMLKKPLILVDRGTIYDGNHSMCAWNLRKYKGQVMVIEKLKGKS